MKLFETSGDIVELANGIFEETGLPQLGVELKIISTTKAKSILKVQRANATTHFLTKKDVVLIVYEEAFDRLTEEHKTLLLTGALSNVAYDTEKDKLLVEMDFAKEIIRMRRKYPNYVDVAEESYMIIEQIEEEERRRKEEERLAKKEKKNNK